MKKGEDRNILNDLLGCSQDISPAGLDEIGAYSPEHSRVTSARIPSVEPPKKDIRDKRVLIVENSDAEYLPSLTVCLEGYDEQFRVRTTYSFESAIVILETGQLADLVVIDLRMPMTEGFKLLAFMNRKYPTVPVIVMSAFSSPEKEEKLQSLGTLRLLNNPLDLDELPEAILAGLRIEQDENSLVDLAMSNFLQLIETEQQTTLLELTNAEQQKAYCFFEEGHLVDALCGDLRGEEAARELMLWDTVEVDFKPPPVNKIKRRITKSLTGILSDIMGVS